MKLRRLKPLGDELLHKAENLLLALVSRAVETDEAIAADHAHVAGKIFLLYIGEKHLGRRAHQMWLNRNRRVEHERESRRLVGGVCTILIDGSLDCLRAHGD